MTFSNQYNSIHSVLENIGLIQTRIFQNFVQMFELIRKILALKPGQDLLRNDGNIQQKLVHAVLVSIVTVSQIWVGIVSGRDYCLYYGIFLGVTIARLYKTNTWFRLTPIGSTDREWNDYYFRIMEGWYRCWFGIKLTVQKTSIDIVPNGWTWLPEARKYPLSIRIHKHFNVFVTQNKRISCPRYSK